MLPAADDAAVVGHIRHCAGRNVYAEDLVFLDSACRIMRGVNGCPDVGGRHVEAIHLAHGDEVSFAIHLCADQSDDHGVDADVFSKIDFLIAHGEFRLVLKCLFASSFNVFFLRRLNQGQIGAFREPPVRREFSEGEPDSCRAF